MSNEDLSERLAGKLASLELAEDEAALLVGMLRQGENDVEGFASGPRKGVVEYQDGDDLLLMPKLRSDDIVVKKNGWIDVLSTDWG